MLKVPKIAIIIPVYNREHLLNYTLDSIIAQSFTDWECILVDDHSTDASFEVMEEYQKKDAHFKAYKRPSELKKGANSCRNFGYTKSNAPFIKWFDSDDIMLPNHLEIAYQIIIENKLDFVVTDTINFDHITGDMIDKPYNFDRIKAVFTAKNYALNQIGWITDDFLATRGCVQNILFNEIITDGDEYNFFIKLLHHTTNGAFINQILTHRRIHENSITIQNKINQTKHIQIIATLKFQTAKDLIFYDNKELICWFLSGYMQQAFALAKLKSSIPSVKLAFKLIHNYFSFSKAVAFIFAIIIVKYLGRGYAILKYART
ncbi:glycosyltransferase family 2 protein [Flavobacterium lacustre]|uniref:glycosyltransferase family 2 protein n=1 Tax=Flavobacterium lacustre TaxID=3016339 RepID=UPI0022B6AE73|nr:glycosyltransferase family 2 protein [Flavobacterium lacustre]